MVIDEFVGGHFSNMKSELTPGVKISITRSITTAFEQYMANIEWSDKLYSLPEFVKEWRIYIENHASWYGKLSHEVKSSPEFHQFLADKINETLEKILSEEPTEEQMKEIEELEKQLGREIDYSCKLEAKYWIDTLKKKQNS